MEDNASPERGQSTGASRDAPDGLAGAQQRAKTERGHASDLAASSRRLHQVVSSITDAVAFVRDPHQDLVITNDLGRAFYSPLIGEGGRTPNLARFLFLDPAALAFYPDWDLTARVCVGAIGAEVKRDPFCPRIQQLVGELFMRSDAFPPMWAAQVLHTLNTGMQRFCHPVVGELTMACEEFTVTAAPGLVMSICTAEPGSRSAERLRLLASWAAVAPADARRP